MRSQRGEGVLSDVVGDGVGEVVFADEGLADDVRGEEGAVGMGEGVGEGEGFVGGVGEEGGGWGLVVLAMWLYGVYRGKFWPTIGVIIEHVVEGCAVYQIVRASG